MSHVSTTAHYGLPIYGDVDVINPLTDFNDCNTAIDNKLYEVAQGTAGVVTDITDVKNLLGSETLDTASQIVTGAINELKASEDALDTRVIANETDVATLQAQMATATTNISNLGTSVAGLQTEMTGKASATALQTLTNKVGTGNLDTVAQNCVDAINEVLSKIPAGGAVQAEDVVYDNTDSGLTATDVQTAIDEINQIIHDTEDAFREYLGELQVTTLTTGQTTATVTYTTTIGATTILTPVCSKYGVSPTAVTYTEHTMTFTFEAQAEDMTVGARVQNVI